MIRKIPWKVLAYCSLAIVLALISILFLDYLSYFFHELGHASSAVLYAFTQKETNLTIGFNYIEFGIPYTQISTLVPQQTISTFPKMMMIYGVLFEFILYSFILILLSRIKKIRQDKLLEWSLSLAFITLIFRDISNNLICGTDGFQVSCNASFLATSNFIYYILLIFFLGVFYSGIILYKYVHPKTNLVIQRLTSKLPGK